MGEPLLADRPMASTPNHDDTWQHWDRCPLLLTSLDSAYGPILKAAFGQPTLFEGATCPCSDFARSTCTARLTANWGWVIREKAKLRFAQPLIFMPLKSEKPSHPSPKLLIGTTNLERLGDAPRDSITRAIHSAVSPLGNSIADSAYSQEPLCLYGRAPHLWNMGRSPAVCRHTSNTGFDPMAPNTPTDARNLVQ